MATFKDLTGKNDGNDDYDFLLEKNADGKKIGLINMRGYYSILELKYLINEIEYLEKNLK